MWLFARPPCRSIDKLLQSANVAQKVRRLVCSPPHRSRRLSFAQPRSRGRYHFGVRLRSSRPYRQTPTPYYIYVRRRWPRRFRLAHEPLVRTHVVSLACHQVGPGVCPESAKNHNGLELCL